MQAFWAQFNIVFAGSFGHNILWYAFVAGGRFNAAPVICRTATSTLQKGVIWCIIEYNRKLLRRVYKCSKEAPKY